MTENTLRRHLKIKCADDEGDDDFWRTKQFVNGADERGVKTIQDLINRLLKMKIKSKICCSLFLNTMLSSLKQQSRCCFVKADRNKLSMFYSGHALPLCLVNTLSLSDCVKHFISSISCLNDRYQSELCQCSLLFLAAASSCCICVLTTTTFSNT